MNLEIVSAINNVIDSWSLQPYYMRVNLVSSYLSCIILMSIKYDYSKMCEPILDKDAKNKSWSPIY